MQLGVASRYRVAQLSASQPWVVFLDDDLLPSADAFKALIAAFSADTNRIVGKWGRSQHVKPFYDTIDCDGLCDVVLTKFMIMRRADIGRFFDYATTMGMDRGLPGSTPVWNGEDIFMSLVNSHCKGVSHKHLAMPNLDVVPLVSLAGSQNAISGDIPKDFRALIPTVRWFGAAAHWWYRGVLWNVIMNKLAWIPCAQTPSSEP